MFAKKSAQREFAEMAARKFRESGAKVARLDERQFSLTLASGAVINLHNVYGEYSKAESENRSRIVDRFVAGMSAMNALPDDLAVAGHSLLPVVRSHWYFALGGLQERAAGKSDRGGPAAKAEVSLAGDLVIRVAYDTELLTQIVTRKQLDKWRVSLDDALVIAVNNLRGRTDAKKLLETSAGVYEGQWDDAYEPSRMLLKELITGLPLRGDPVVFVPQRGRLLVAGSEDRDGLQAMIEKGKGSHFEPYAISPYLYLLQHGKWEQFTPNDAELRESLAFIARQRLALDYRDQKGYLEAIYKKEETDVFVPTFQIWVDKETKREYSACVWTNGVDSLLPKTERVVLLINVETKERIVVSWDTLQANVGRLMELESDLIRYRVRSFPGPEEIAKLRILAAP